VRASAGEGKRFEAPGSRGEEVCEVKTSFRNAAGVVTAILLAVASGWCAESVASSLEPAELRCEYRRDPVNVDATQPRFQWLSRAIDASRRSLRQTAYRVLVASTDAVLQEDRGDMWDSGKVAANRSIDIRYNGRVLQPHAKYCWKVQLWDQDDEPTIWSQPESFTTGPFSDHDWVAQWITAPDGQPTAALPIFRRQFEITKPVRHAVMFICGLGHYELHLNGQRVGDFVMDPGWTNYRRTCLYSGYDVTDRLQVGDNAVGVMLGNGMYNVTGGRYVKFTGSFGPPKLICQLHVTFTDGTTQIVASDPAWRTTPGPVTFSCIYGGEDYDARREQPGWDTSAYDDSAWAAVTVCKGPGGRLVAQYAPPIQVAERLSPVAIERLGPGQYEIDCGVNLSARPFFKVRGRRGDQVTVTCAEQKGHPWEGHSYTYTLKGDGEESFTPRFTYFSFQYLYVSGADRLDDANREASRPVLLEVGSEFVTSSASDVGEFRCSDPLLNGIDAMISRSVRSNLQCLLTDCPHREKLGWLEVSHLMGPSIFYHQDAHQLYRKICRDTSESQLESGLVPDIAPEYTRFAQGFFESAEWGSAAVQLPFLLYRWYGDSDVLREQYETMARYVRYLAGTRNDQGLAKPGLGDWYDWTPENGHAGYSQLTPLELTATAFLFDNARIVAQVANMLGQQADYREFSDLTEQVRRDFQRAYVDPAKETVSTGSQAAIATALYFGLVPDDRRQQMLAALIRTLEENGYRQTTGEVCFRMLVQTLADAGRSDVVFRMLDRDDPPGYGYMLKLGFKTLSETWDRPGSSMNHCMFGHAREWFQKSVLGIQQAPGSVGFQDILLIPEPVGDLTSAEGHYDSAYGRITSAWRVDAGAFEWQVSVPPNTSAVLQIPAQRVEDVMESGAPVARAAGVKVVGSRQPAEEDTGFARVILEVGSGQYRFRSKLPEKTVVASHYFPNDH
jgi:alpha-L-rhamnosidase